MSAFGAAHASLICGAILDNLLQQVIDAFQQCYLGT